MTLSLYKVKFLKYKSFHHRNSLLLLKITKPCNYFDQVQAYNHVLLFAWYHCDQNKAHLLPLIYWSRVLQKLCVSNLMQSRRIHMSMLWVSLLWSLCGLFIYFFCCSVNEDVTMPPSTACPCVFVWSDRRSWGHNCVCVSN